jgi:hypothetical protein
MMLAILASLELFAQSWSLPQGASVKDDGPRTYRFTVEYFMANTQGETTGRQRLTGEYTRALADGDNPIHRCRGSAVRCSLSP